MSEKCPVCKNEINFSDEKCSVCGFSDLHKDFINKEDAENWMKTVVEPYRKKYDESLRRTRALQYGSDGFDEEGYNKDGFNRIGYNRGGFDKDGYDRLGYDKFGFNKITGLNREGYDRQGYDKDGYGKDGFDRQGYNKSGYDRSGYNSDGLDSHGFDRNGYNKYGYDKNGYNRYGYDKGGYNRNGYNAYGYDKFGFDKEGYDKKGFNKNGVNKLGINKDEFDADGYHKLTGFNSAGYDRSGYNVNGVDEYGHSKKINHITENLFSFPKILCEMLVIIQVCVYFAVSFDWYVERWFIEIAIIQWMAIFCCAYENLLPVYLTTGILSVFPYVVDGINSSFGFATYCDKFIDKTKGVLSYSDSILEKMKMLIPYLGVIILIIGIVILVFHRIEKVRNLNSAFSGGVGIMVLSAISVVGGFIALFCCANFVNYSFFWGVVGIIIVLGGLLGTCLGWLEAKCWFANIKVKRMKNNK